jgi:antitoxin component YwqK of YwqJK toxin-antitoxin module
MPTGNNKIYNMKKYIISLILLLQIHNTYCQSKFFSNVPSDTIFEYCHGICEEEIQIAGVNVHAFTDAPPPPPGPKKNQKFSNDIRDPKNGVRNWYYENEDGNYKHKNNKLAAIEVFKNGKRDGEWKEYYENGNLKWLKHFNNDKEDGEWREFYESGKLKKKINFKDGKVHGECISYYESGEIETSSFYKDGFRFHIYSYYTNGTISRFENYNKDHLEDGEWRVNYENGDAKEISNFKNGKRNGQWKEYYPNGKLRSIKIFFDGKAEGEWKIFWENGTVSRVGNYENDQLNGEVYFFNLKGDLIQKQVFNNGELLNSILY